jgi:hypothetical protein
MKKKLIIAALFAAVAMASYGGNALVTHAQTAPSNTAALQQQLDDAKAQLIQLEMQAGQVPAGDNGTATAQPTVVSSAPTVTLSAADISEMNTALTALAGVLTNLQTQIAENPQFVTTNGPAVIGALQGISNTIASIGTEMAGANVAMSAMPSTGSTGSMGSTGVAQANPATTGNIGSGATTPTTQPSQVAQTNPAATTPTTVNSAPANTAPVATVPSTAQASSAFSFSKLNWPLIIVIILIVAAIAIWLWWDDGEEKKPVVARSNSPAPQKSVQQPLQSTTTQVSINSQGQNANRQPASSQTPLSSAVAPQGNR